MTEELMTGRMKQIDEASRDGDVSKLRKLLTEDPSMLDRFDHNAPVREARDNPLHIAAWHGHIDFAAEVLRLMPQLAECANKEGRLPLHLAAARGHLQVVTMLADRADQVLVWYGREVLLSRDSKYGYMPAHIATANRNYDIVQILVERCRDVLDMTTGREETLLHLAVKANCFDSVHYFINHGVNLNEKDDDGNTCLHLACKQRNDQVITYLLEQEGIEVNSTNKRGLTPLDVLLVPSCDSAIDISLMNMLREAGGEEGTEQGTFSSRKRQKEKMHNDAKTLLVVATLVATMAFTAISNPPGGFIQLPFEKDDENYDTLALQAGRPVLLWELQIFFLLDSVALFSSVFVILSLLCGIPKTKFMMKLLASVVWLAAFCMAFASAYVYLSLYVPDDSITITQKDGHFHETREEIRAMKSTYFITWSIVYVGAGLWGSIRVIIFVWKKGGFKRNVPNWVDRVGWPKNVWFRKITSVIFVICFLALLGFSTFCIVGLGFMN